MLAFARTSAPSRLAAVAVAFALTGAPGIAGLHAPEPEHHCSCRAGGRAHECGCSRCHAATGPAKPASGERSPPCHGAVPGRPAPAPERDRSAPCWTGSCGSTDPAALSPLALEAFTVPREARLSAPAFAGRVISQAGEGLEAVLSPELPPPRAA